MTENPISLIMDVRTSHMSFWEDTIQPVTKELISFGEARENVIWGIHDPTSVWVTVGNLWGISANTNLNFT